MTSHKICFSAKITTNKVSSEYYLYQDLYMLYDKSGVNFSSFPYAIISNAIALVKALFSIQKY